MFQLTLLRAYASLPRSPPWLLSDNIQIHDAFGQRMSLPFEHFRHWNVLVAALEHRFKGTPGELKIRNRNFVFFMATRKQEVLVEHSWEHFIHRRAKVFMSMYLNGVSDSTDRCFKCGAAGQIAASLGWRTW